MRSISELFWLSLPAAISLLLLGIFSAPLTVKGLTLTPNVAWIMTLVVAVMYPAAWPRGFAFALGLLQDVVFGTPLGSQALLALLLVTLVERQAERHRFQRFRLRWLEAAGVLILWHGLLWGLMQFATGHAPPLVGLLLSGAVSALWYPAFYYPVARLVGVTL